MLRTSVAALLVLAGSAGWSGAQERDKDCVELVRQAVKAHGGEKVLESAKAVTLNTKGTVQVMGGLKFTSEDKVQLPDKFRTDIQIDAGGMTINVTQVFDGKKGWVKAGDNVIALDDKAVSESKAILYAGRVTNLVEVLKDKNFALSPVGEDKVNDRPVVGVLVKHKGQRDISLYFDKKTHMLAKTVMTAYDQMSQQEVQQEKIFNEYKAIDGRQVPHKVTINHDGKPYVEVEVTGVSIVERHDPSVFAKPE
jgi:hypothetical protein